MNTVNKALPEFLVRDNYALAIDLLTRAIGEASDDAELATIFAHHAEVNILLRNFTEAIADATKAIELDPLARAYMIRGNARYEAAKAEFEAAASKTGDSRFTNLINMCEECIAEATRQLPKPSAENRCLYP